MNGGATVTVTFGEDAQQGGMVFRFQAARD
jgi:hypothetical protein